MQERIETRGRGSSREAIPNVVSQEKTGESLDGAGLGGVEVEGQNQEVIKERGQHDMVSLECRDKEKNKSVNLE